MFWISQALAQSAVEAEKTLVEQQGIMHVVGNADPVVKLTLIILIFFSVVSWAIIGYKYLQLKKAKKFSQDFWTQFSQSRTLEDFYKSRYEKEGPLYTLFNSAVQLMPLIQKSGKNTAHLKSTLQLGLSQVREEEIYKLEQYTPFLATTASTAPFVGLFGTVWGILMAFSVIGKAGTSSLATVGPYISEALIATAIGLAAAIPAVIAYNYFVNHIKNIIRTLDLFLDQLVHKIEEEVLS